jgi:hypothetical protein
MIMGDLCRLRRDPPPCSTIFPFCPTLASGAGFCIPCPRYCCWRNSLAPRFPAWRISSKSGCGATSGSIFSGVSSYERGLPAHDTLNDVINGLDADLFKTCFANWVEARPT